MKYTHNQKGIPKDVKEEIQSLCAGYYRRQRIAKQRTAILTAPPSEELTAFMTYNEKIDRALEFLEEGLRPYILHDIANGIGYWRSMASPLISRNAYYARKNESLERIAKELNLMI